MQTGNTIEELRRTATHELDQMDKALALAKSFSQMFDEYMRKLSGLVKGLLDAENYEDDILLSGISYQATKPVFPKKEIVDAFKKRISNGSRETAQDGRRNLISGLGDNIYELQSAYTANFNSEPQYNDYWRRDSLNFNKQAESTKEDSMISALQIQNMTINKIIEAGEVNSKNLREVLEKMFTGKETSASDEKHYNEILKLKKKISRLKAELEAKDSENQKLRIDLNVTQTLKREVESLYSSYKKETPHELGSGRLSAKSCRSCEAYKVENTMLMTQLDFSVKKVEVLSQSVEDMRNDFIELYKTTQDRCYSVAYQSNPRDYGYGLNESQGFLYNNGQQQSLDSNYNTIIHKLGNLEAGLWNQNHMIQRNTVYDRPTEHSYTSCDAHRRNDGTTHGNNTNLVDFKYSAITNEGLSDCRPKSDHGRKPQDNPPTSFNYSVPLEKILMTTDRNSPTETTTKNDNLRRSQSEGSKEIEVTLPKKLKAVKEPKASHRRGGMSDDDYKADDEPDHVNDCRESEERYSIVEMVQSMQNSLDVRDSLMKSHTPSDKNNLLRISFANRKDLPVGGWADVQVSKDTNDVIIENDEEPDQAVEDHSDSEDLHVTKPQPALSQFYTFSNKNSERKVNDISEE